MVAYGPSCLTHPTTRHVWSANRHRWCGKALYITYVVDLRSFSIKYWKFIGLATAKPHSNLWPIYCALFVLVVLLPILLVPAKDGSFPTPLVALSILGYVIDTASAFAGHWLGTLIMR